MPPSEGPTRHLDAVTVLFADLVGFTAMTEAHGDEEAARAATRLVELTHDAYDGDAIVVKSIGDAVMAAFAEVDTAVAAGLALAHAAHAEPRFPGLRVGIHTGPAVRRDGDLFGSTVNVAARVTDEAAAGQVLVTDAVRSRWTTTSGLVVEERGPVRLRNVRAPVALSEVRESGHDHDAEVDPVCRMELRADADGVVERTAGGRTLRFCSRGCARLFARHPEGYAP